MRCLAGPGNRSSTRSGPRRQRRGTVLVVVLVVLVVLTAILGSSVRTGLSGRELLSMQERVRQADWLAESGLNRAASRLVDDPDYKGEAWVVPAVELAARDEAVVRITVEVDDASEHQRRITATAEFPVGADRHATRTRSLLVDLGHDDTTGSSDERDRDNENNEAPEPTLEETR